MTNQREITHVESIKPVGQETPVQQTLFESQATSHATNSIPILNSLPKVREHWGDLSPCIRIHTQTCQKSTGWQQWGGTLVTHRAQLAWLLQNLECEAALPPLSQCRPHKAKGGRDPSDLSELSTTCRDDAVLLNPQAAEAEREDKSHSKV